MDSRRFLGSGVLSLGRIAAQQCCIEIKWEPAVDPDFVAAQTCDESDAILTGLPRGKTVKIKVNAFNDAGDGPASAVAENIAP